jgi:hypothetical protein
MSFVIRGGYDIFRKQVLNVTLKHSDKWSQGLVMVKHNMFLSQIMPLNENKLEIVKYHGSNVLLLNDNIIYENKKLFSYKIELNGLKEFDLNDPHLYDFLECKYVDCYAMKHFGDWRVLN